MSTRKLRLDVDSLHVQSFSVDGAHVDRGTVLGNHSPEPTTPEYFTCYIDPTAPCGAGETCANSCVYCETDFYLCPTPMCTSMCPDETFACSTTWCRR